MKPSAKPPELPDGQKHGPLKKFLKDKETKPISFRGLDLDPKDRTPAEAFDDWLIAFCFFLLILMVVCSTEIADLVSGWIII